MNAQVRTDPGVLAELARQFERTAPGVKEAVRALRAARGDSRAALGHESAPGTWAAVEDALAGADRELRQVRAAVEATPAMLGACAEGYLTGDRLAAELLRALDTGADPPAPLSLAGLAAPAAPVAPPHAVVRADRGAGLPQPFRLPPSGALDFGARVAGVGSSASPAVSPRVTPTPAGRDTAVLSEDEPRTTTPPRDVRRSTIIRRARRWADLGLGYSMADTFEGYRTDCSGIVSMAWGLPAPGMTTVTLPDVAHRIDKDDLQPGDILLNTAPGAAGHTLLFAGWADAAHTQYFAYEESGGKGAHFGTVPYPYWPGHGTFRPYRMNALDG
ncbi:hypothetical protein [Yinghuangia seranimata]|uniref:hypothetical protein n=1 Tax=Yinghuangia seranimata TaxID=408067 RepID=UPI00248C1EDE|nr:hypothetical protein [Yinghuangia seranimata]MDI2130775.1 hypothetical protein [Yinghuangia seranimata]